MDRPIWSQKLPSWYWWRKHQQESVLESVVESFEALSIWQELINVDQHWWNTLPSTSMEHGYLQDNCFHYKMIDFPLRLWEERLLTRKHSWQVKRIKSIQGSKVLCLLMASRNHFPKAAFVISLVQFGHSSGWLADDAWGSALFTIARVRRM